MEKLIIAIIVVLGLFLIYRYFNSLRKGEPTGDELSRLIVQKSSSLAFYVSLYLWILISYFSDRLNFETDQLIGYGIIAMAIIFAGIWSIFKIIGLKKD